MKVIVLHSFLLLTYTSQIKCGYKDTIALSECEVVPLVVYPGEESADTLYEFSVNLRNINDDGGKVLDFDITVDEPLSPEFIVIVKIDQWNNGAWQTDIFNAEGSLCEYLEKYTKKIWEKLRQMVDPPVEPVCGWPAGSFKMRDFTLSSDDIEIPVSAYGKFRVSLKVLNPEGDLVFCQTGEAEINRKE